MHPKRLAFIAAMGLLTVPSVAQAYTIKGYGVRDAGDRIVHRLTICSPPSDRLHRFEVAARSELLDGGDKRIRYGSVYARGCERWRFSYPDNLRLAGTYYGRIKVRLEQTDWIQYTRWRPFPSR